MDLYLSMQILFQIGFYIVKILKLLYVFFDITLIPGDTLLGLLLTLVFMIIIGTYILNLIWDCVFGCGRICCDIFLLLLAALIIFWIYFPEGELIVK